MAIYLVGNFQQNRRLWILVVRDDREVIGIAPFLIRKVCYYGIFPFRRVELLGTGEDEEDEICPTGFDDVHD